MSFSNKEHDYGFSVCLYIIRQGNRRGDICRKAFKGDHIFCGEHEYFRYLRENSHYCPYINNGHPFCCSEVDAGNIYCSKHLSKENKHFKRYSSDGRDYIRMALCLKVRFLSKDDDDFWFTDDDEILKAISNLTAEEVLSGNKVRDVVKEGDDMSVVSKISKDENIASTGNVLSYRLKDHKRFSNISDKVAKSTDTKDAVDNKKEPSNNIVDNKKESIEDIILTLNINSSKITPSLSSFTDKKLGDFVYDLIKNPQKLASASDTIHKEVVETVNLSKNVITTSPNRDSTGRLLISNNTNDDSKDIKQDSNSKQQSIDTSNIITYNSMTELDIAINKLANDIVIITNQKSLNVNQVLDFVDLQSDRYLNLYSGKLREEKSIVKYENIDQKNRIYSYIKEEKKKVDIPRAVFLMVISKFDKLLTLMNNKKRLLVEQKVDFIIDKKDRIDDKRKGVPEAVKLKLIEQHKNMCATCGTHINRSFSEMGHIKPHIFGGEETESNLLPICRGCNTKMSTSNMYEYIFREGKRKRYLHTYLKKDIEDIILITSKIIDKIKTNKILTTEYINKVNRILSPDNYKIYYIEARKELIRLLHPIVY